MQVEYNKPAIQGFIGDMSQVDSMMRRTQDGIRNRYEQSEKQYRQIAGELEELTRRAFLKVSDLQGELRVLQSQYDTLMRQASDEEDEYDNRAAAEAREIAERMHEVHEELDEAQREYQRLQEKFLELQGIWEKFGRAADAANKRIEEGFSSYSSVSGSASRDLESFMVSMDLAQSSLYGSGVASSIISDVGSALGSAASVATGVVAGAAAAAEMVNLGRRAMAGMAGVGASVAAAGASTVSGIAGAAACELAAGVGGAGRAASAALSAGAHTAAVGNTPVPPISGVVSGSASAATTGGSGGGKPAEPREKAVPRGSVPRWTAVHRSEEGRKTLSMQIGSGQESVPLTKSGAARAYRKAKSANDPESILRCNTIFEIETLRETLELEPQGEPGILQLGGYHRDVRGNPGYESHHIPQRSVQLANAEDLPSIALTREDHKKTDSYAGKSGHVHKPIFPSNTSYGTYKQEVSDRIREGDYISVVRNELYNIRDQFGHKYDGAISQYLDALADMIASRGIPKEK